MNKEYSEALSVLTPLNGSYAPDYLDPKWGECRKVHDWKNYVNEEVRYLWRNLSPTQRMLIARNFQEMADNEDWD